MSNSKTVQEYFDAIRVQIDEFEKKCESNCRYNPNISSYECFANCANLTNERIQSLATVFESVNSNIKIVNN
jgi:hypothetical protein